MSNLTHTDSMMNEIRELLLNARQRVAIQVNTELLSTYWNIGKVLLNMSRKIKTGQITESRHSNSFQKS